MPHVDVQLDGRNSTVPILPGDKIAGNIIVTSSSEISCREVSVEVTAKLRFDSTYFKEERSSPSDAECDLSSARPFRSLSPQIMFPRQSHNINGQGDEIILLYMVKAISCNDCIRPGVTLRPFTLEIPNEHLCPSLKDPRVSVQYVLKGIAKTPAPLLPWLDWKTKSSPTIIELGQRVEEAEINESRQRVTVHCEGQVGEWDESSLEPRNRLKYILGADVAKTWTKVIAKTSLPALILLSSEQEPYYLQDALHLTLTTPLNDISSVIPNVLIENLKITISTTIKLKSRYQYHSSSFQRIVVSVDGSHLAVESGTVSDQELDITSLISGTKIYENIIPSVSSPEIDITHNCNISFALRSHNVNGVKQSSTKYRLSLPLKLIRISKGGKVA